MSTKPKNAFRNRASLDPDTMKRIELAVLEVFSKVDFHEANMREVAKQARVSLNTIYQNFSSKEGLLFFFVDRWLKGLTERTIDHLQGIEDLKERLRKAFWLQIDFYEKHIAVGKILFFSVPFQKWMADKTFRQQKLFEVFLDVMKKGQREGKLSKKVRAGTLIDIMNGIFYRSFTMWIYRGQKGNLTSQADVLFEMYWRAISTDG
jgi:AcrR family transcriptional regulator